MKFIKNLFKSRRALAAAVTLIAAALGVTVSPELQGAIMLIISAAL
ncbi:MAG: hypothetical protein RPT25_13975 [Cycloclasticus sp.]